MHPGTEMSGCFCSLADEDLRVFLKEEAIKQFDNDYEVFYPYVKDETISGGRTFKEILVEHAGSESKLQEIEEVLPLLTLKLL